MDAIVTVSDFVSNALKQRFPDFKGPIATIRNGVDTVRYQPRAATGGDGRKLLLCVGRVSPNWRLTAEDKQQAATIKLLGAEFGRCGADRVRSWLTGDDLTWPGGTFGDQHHTGTARMHRDATMGVVDPNCAVHGIPNLYVAASSVFPTSGGDNPTLTIVALALRLADHIKDQLA